MVEKAKSKEEALEEAIKSIEILRDDPSAYCIIKML